MSFWRVGAMGLLALATCVSNPLTERKATGETGGVAEAATASETIPSSWLTAWKNPPAIDRPLQIVHGINFNYLLSHEKMTSTPNDDPQETAVRALRVLKDRGLGGIVCNAAFDDYLRSEANWKTLELGVEACKRLGMVVWLYDEKGYPSGSAGGLVLKAKPECQAQELAYDASKPDPFVVRPAYEFTHASNNYAAARHYINLIDDRATKEFLQITHEEYRKRLKPYMGSVIQATFTDEPSLITVNLGQIPESARKSVPIEDPLDPTVKMLPAVPWSYDLLDRYREKYGEDLMPHRLSLFAGDSPEDRQVRERYWGLIADLTADRYFGAIQKWCATAKLASSGHTLWEESLIHHPTLEGDALKVLGRMDIPGLDMLSSDPAVVTNNGWMTAGLPSSAALVNGRRRVMTEISDFSEKMSGQSPASLAEMQAATAWQASWGVTDFNLYYSLDDRSAADYKAYGDTVGRLNAILKPARFDPDVLLYYPVHDLWSEYKPTAEPISFDTQSPRALRVVESFQRLGGTLQRSQIPFALIDHEGLAGAKAGADGGLIVRGRRFRALVVPEDVQFPAAAAAVLKRFRKSGGRVLQDGEGAGRIDAAILYETIAPDYRLTPGSERIALGRFLRGGKRILIAANVGKERYQGTMTAGGAKGWTALDPATGEVGAAATDEAGNIRLNLEPRGTVILISGS